MPGISDPAPSVDSSASTVQGSLSDGSAKFSSVGSAGSKFKSVLNKLRYGPKPAGTTSSSDKQIKRKEAGEGKASSPWKPKKGQYAGEMRLNF